MKSSAINEEKMQTLKTDLLDTIEKLNTIFNQLDIEFDTLNSSISGNGKIELMSKCNAIRNEYPTIRKNILVYANDIGKVIDSYRRQDEEMAQHIMSNIGRLE